MYWNSYTLAGCNNPARCGVFTRVEAEHAPPNPTLCDDAPVYQNGGRGSGGPVLYRITGSAGTYWVVGEGSYALAHCGSTGPDTQYLASDERGPPGLLPTSAAGWFAGYNTRDQRSISVTAGGGW